MVLNCSTYSCGKNRYSRSTFSRVPGVLSPTGGPALVFLASELGDGDDAVFRNRLKGFLGIVRVYLARVASSESILFAASRCSTGSTWL